jgi:hypothetical protein
MDDLGSDTDRRFRECGVVVVQEKENHHKELSS